jgi:hypothetical protein
MCKILANMTQVSDVAPGPLVYCMKGFERENNPNENIG